VEFYDGSIFNLLKSSILLKSRCHPVGLQRLEGFGCGRSLEMVRAVLPCGGLRLVCGRRGRRGRADLPGLGGRTAAGAAAYDAVAGVF
jgi:hypothetical protein